MNGGPALCARHAAMSASAWLTLAALAASRRLVAAAVEWDSYCSPQLGEPAEKYELFDQLGGVSAPPVFGEVVADVTAQLPKAARRAH
jgi:hypothetical protein